MSLDGTSRILMRRFTDTLNNIVEEHCLDQLEQGLAVAYSGGLDSSVLLALANKYCQEHGVPLLAFHVHHGLSPHADDWSAHCASVCAAHGVRFFVKQVTVSNDNGHGIEASARAERYRALGKLCQDHQINLLLTAHQQDDQAETLLLQMLRGSGVAGMAGMNMCHRAPKLFGNEAIFLARPLLAESRLTLEEFATRQGVAFVQDESNFDPRFIRNALRHQVMPILSKISPGYAERIARGAMHIQSAHDTLTKLAEQDLQLCKLDQELDITAMQSLDGERVNNLMRFWLAQLGARMPSTSRLKEMLSQLFSAREDARVTIYHEHLAIHRYKNKVYASDNIREKNLNGLLKTFSWNGEAAIYFPEFRGTLLINDASHGIDKQWLKIQSLTLQLRKGGERLKLAHNRPTRTIKSHYQALQIPFWQREQLPFLAVNNQILFAAGVGMQSIFCVSDETPSVDLSWESDPASFSGAGA
ncbi:MAG: tRNA lysidine(34) synthetase TilS [Burkholderiales bacterium]|nr:tRNA lysidine(34) synthetase TilS [Burkholderiales bacterium]